MFSAMSYANGRLRLIDQLRLPSEEIWHECSSLEEVAQAIETMIVRGAPAIGCAAAFGLAIDARAQESKEIAWKTYADRFAAGVERLARTRPTAVNLFYALERMREAARSVEASASMRHVAELIEATAKALYAEDLATCRAIGAAGLSIAPEGRLKVLTHCNTGSLATAGYGTALGVIRALHEAGKLEHVHADETRPYLQGARLTAFELLREKIPFTLNVDAAAASLMRQGQVDWVIVGADRIAANGDTANKIGTYSLAVLAKHHGIPFFVAAPLSTFDPAIASGEAIPVEQRSEREVTHHGGVAIAPSGIRAHNPSFDVTPNALITAFITEVGVCKPPYVDSIGRALSHSVVDNSYRPS